MKYFQIILIISLLGGCSYKKEEYNFLGTVPYYAVDKPHAKSCPCCGAQLHENSFGVKKDKKKS